MIGKQSGYLTVAATELDRRRAVLDLHGRDVQRVGVEFVWLAVALRVVQADRPEAANRHIFDIELLDRGAIVPARHQVELAAALFGG
jgi:hypothetical protein